MFSTHRITQYNESALDSECHLSSPVFVHGEQRSNGNGNDSHLVFICYWDTTIALRKLRKYWIISVGEFEKRCQWIAPRHPYNIAMIEVLISQKYAFQVDIISHF